jgi:predicted permease
MFSVFDGAVLRPMAVPSPHRLVSVQAVNPKIQNVPASLSWIRFDNSLRHAKSFSRVAAYDFESASVVVGTMPPEQVSALRTTSGFLETLGVGVGQGRGFVDSDDLPNGAAVCLVSADFAHSRLAGSAVGQTISVNGRATEVVGVLKPRFSAPWSAVQVIVPRLFETPTMRPDNVASGSSYLAVVGRLEGATSLEAAQSELDALAASYANQFVGKLDAANSTRAFPFVDSLVAARRPTLSLLLAAVGAVLLVASLNASGLFLARLIAGKRAIAVRQALGAQRSRLVRELLMESVILSSLATALGLALAWGLIRVVQSAFANAIPNIQNIGLDARAVSVAGLVMLLTALVVGLWPALSVTRASSNPLAAFSRDQQGTSSGRRARSILVFAEIAMSCILLIGAAFLTKSLTRLQQANPGFGTASTAAGLITLPAARYPDPERQGQFALDAVERLKHAPGVSGAAAVFGLPLGDSFTFHQYVIGGQTIPPPSERERAGIRLVTEDYFELLGIGLKAGRYFTPHDRRGAKLVCIVNDAMSRRMFGGSPLGKTIRRGRDANIEYEIVGVVQDIRTFGVRRDSVEEVFYPIRQLPWPLFALVVRTTGDPAALRRVVEGVVAEMDPTLPVAQFATMQARLDATWSTDRAVTSLTLLFAAVALFMAVVGLYTTLSNLVVSRSSEIGLRMALGADRRSIIHMVLVQGMVIAGGGILVGAMAALGLTRFLSAQLYEINPVDPWVYLVVTGLFGGVALMACFVPSWRASRIDPLVTLRRA